MKEFLEKLCTVCRACTTLITLVAGPDQCDNCVSFLKRTIKTENQSPPAISPKRKTMFKQEPTSSQTQIAEPSVPSSSPGIICNLHKFQID